MIPVVTNIKNLMEEKGVTVNALSQRLDISPQAIYHWFYGVSLPTIEHIYSIADILEVPVHTLFYDNK